MFPVHRCSEASYLLTLSVLTSVCVCVCVYVQREHGIPRREVKTPDLLQTNTTQRVSTLPVVYGPSRVHARVCVCVCVCMYVNVYILVSAIK